MNKLFGILTITRVNVDSDIYHRMVTLGHVAWMQQGPFLISLIKQPTKKSGQWMYM